MLGSPVLDPLSVGPVVLKAVRSVARLGDLGVPGAFSSECANGECCAPFWRDLAAPIPDAVRAIAIYSQSDGIVSWQACLDPCARHIEVDSSHIGMAVNREVYGTLSDEPLAFDPRVLITGQKRVEGFWLSEWARAQGKLAMLGLFRRIGRLLRAGVLTSEVGTTFALEEIREAARRASEPGRRGKVLLRLSAER